MRIGEFNSRLPRHSGGQANPSDAEAPVADSRALVPIVSQRAEGERAPPRDHRCATFLAHLIATKNHLPQTRERRRAEPADATAAYRAAGKLVG